LALLNSGFIREKEVDMWRAAAGDPYPMEKAEDEVPMFARFVERGLALPASDFFKGLLRYYGVEYLNLNPNGIFHTAVFVHFCEAFLGIKPHWILFRKFFRVKPQPSASNPRVVGGAGIQMREDAAEQYLAYKLIDSNADWKARWFYITNHHPGLPKPSGRQPKHRDWWNTEPTMQEGIQLPELLARIKVLREAGLRAEHVAFSFMKRRVQPLMARDTLGFEYTGDDDSSRMPGGEVDDDEETLQDRFQLRSRFSRPGLPLVPLVQGPPASLEASLAAPQRKPRNLARKRVTKKLKVSETTPQEVRGLD
jgi:hypothetical protein